MLEGGQGLEQSVGELVRLMALVARMAVSHRLNVERLQLHVHD